MRCSLCSIEVEAGFLGTDSSQVGNAVRLLLDLNLSIARMLDAAYSTDERRCSLTLQSAFLVKDLASGVGIVRSAMLRGNEVISFKAEAPKA